MWTVKEKGKLVTEKDKDWDYLDSELSELCLVFPEGTVCFSIKESGFFQFKNATIDVFPKVGKSEVVSQTIGRVLNSNGDCETKTFNFKTRKFTQEFNNINDMKLNKDVIK